MPEIPWTILAAYLLGSIPFALILARRWGTSDLRRVGSGNPGATNVLRTLGVTPGVLVALLDMAKGALSVWLADRLSGSASAPAAAGVAAVVGHVWPVWLGFRGGKGVATACGVFSILTPLATLVAFAVFVLTVSITRFVSMGSVLASVALPPTAYATGSGAATVMSASLVALLIISRHRTNLARLRRGTERGFATRERQQ